MIGFNQKKKYAIYSIVGNESIILNLPLKAEKFFEIGQKALLLHPASYFGGCLGFKWLRSSIG